MDNDLYNEHFDKSKSVAKKILWLVFEQRTHPAVATQAIAIALYAIFEQSYKEKSDLDEFMSKFDYMIRHWEGLITKGDKDNG